MPIGLALVLGVGAARAWRRPAVHPAPVGPPSRLERAAVAAVIVGWLGGVLAIPAWDQPFGTDWMVYLKNAVAMAAGDWEAWHRWRAPGHAVASLALVPLAGGLVEASQLLAALAGATILGMGWSLGRRAGGRLGGAAALALLAAWPDLWVFGRTSTPYPLLAALFAVGLRGLAGSTPGGALIAVLALAGASLTDLRGGPLAAAALGGALLGAALDRDAGRGLRGLAVGLGVLALASLGWALFPVDLTPLGEQVGLQRDLHAREGLRGLCVPTGGRLPGLAEAFDACARATFAGNLARTQAVAPVPVAFAAGLLVFGAGARRGAPELVLPLLSAVPAFLWIGVEHRYLLPLAAPAAVLVGAAVGGVGRRAGTGVAVGLGGLLVMVLLRDGGSLWARAHGRERGRQVATAAILGADTAMVQARRVIRAEAGPADRVVDCAQAALAARLYPRPAEDGGGGGGGRASPRCRRLVGGAPPPGEVTWVLTPVGPDTPVAPGWEERLSVPRGPGRLVLVRGDGTPTTAPGR